jgi:hypothetical protein
MKLSTAIRWKIAITFVVVLFLLGLYWPTYGIPLALGYAALVLWQAKKQGILSK